MDIIIDSQSVLKDLINQEMLAEKVAIQLREHFYDGHFEIFKEAVVKEFEFKAKKIVEELMEEYDIKGEIKRAVQAAYRNITKEELLNLLLGSAQSK